MRDRTTDSGTPSTALTRGRGRGRPTRSGYGLALVTLLAAALPAALSGCADLQSFDSPTAFEEATASGQTLVFVGTSPQTLRTEIYLVHAVGVGTGIAPSITEADSFQLEAITNTDVESAGSLLLRQSDKLLSDRQPFPIPDRAGNRIALVITSEDPAGSGPAGRLASIQLSPRETRMGPELPGLFGARFSWTGNYLLLEVTDPETGRDGLLTVGTEAQEDTEAYLALGPTDPDINLNFVAPIQGADTFLALATNTATGDSEVYVLDPGQRSEALVTGQVETPVSEPVMSSDGRLLAGTTHSSDTADRSIVVVEVATGAMIEVTDGAESDCYWPSFAPSAQGVPVRLAFVCQDPDPGRPDIVLWTEPSDEAEDGLAQEIQVLTSAPQPGVFDGTMDGLVVRSRPHWDPSGDFLIFGASTEDEAFDGIGMTLLVLPVDSTAYPIYSGSDTSVDWAHFSTSSETRNLLVWERSETGLEDTSATSSDRSHPIRVVATDVASPEPSYVSLGIDLRVGYPLFLGENSLFYP